DAPRREACAIRSPLHSCSSCPLAQWGRAQKSYLPCSCISSIRPFAPQLERLGTAAAIHERRERAFSETPIVSVFSSDFAIGRWHKQATIAKFNAKTIRRCLTSPQSLPLQSPPASPARSALTLPPCW